MKNNIFKHIKCPVCEENVFQCCNSLLTCFFPFIKRYIYRGFYPSGNFDVDFIFRK